MTPHCSLFSTNELDLAVWHVVKHPTNVYMKPCSLLKVSELISGGPLYSLQLLPLPQRLWMAEPGTNLKANPEAHRTPTLCCRHQFPRHVSVSLYPQQQVPQ